MNRIMIVGAGALSTAAVALMTFGTGTAAAINEYAGQTYADATQAISDAGQSAVIATRVGSFLPTDECMVTGSRSANFLDSSGINGGGRVLLYLNCNDTYAKAGIPGNSLGSPEGRRPRPTPTRRRPKSRRSRPRPRRPPWASRASASPG